jgi:DMSO reductase anchor subunit
MLVVAVGVTPGLAGSALLTGLMESLLCGVGALDVTTYVTVSAIVVFIAALAAYLPARRVTRIDPMQAQGAEVAPALHLLSQRSRATIVWETQMSWREDR